MTINDLIDEIIQEVGGDTDDSELETLVLGFLKAGMRRTPAFIRDRNFVGVGTLALALGANTASIDLLTGFIREREIWYLGDNNIHIPVYRPPSLEYFHRIVTPSSPGKPVYYRIYGRTIEFDKKADSAITIGVDYFKAIGAIIGSDTFVGDEQIAEAVKDRAKSIYYADYEEDVTKGINCERRARDIETELQANYEIEEQGGHIDEKN